MKSRLITIFILSVGITLFHSCKKYVSEDTLYNPSELFFKVIEQTKTFHQIKLAYTVSNGVYVSTGIVSSTDSLSLVQQIERNVIAEIPIPEVNHIYRVSFDRPANATKIFYSFYVEHGDGTVFYNPITHIDFGTLTFTSEGFTDDHNALASLGMFDWQRTNSCDCDFRYIFEERIQRRESLRVTINGTDVPFNLTVLENSILEVKIPEHLLSGMYELRFYYDGSEIHYRSFFIPIGKMNVAGTHPRSVFNKSVGYFTYGNNIRFVLPYPENGYPIEYSSWNPVYNQWTVVNTEAINNIPTNNIFTSEGKIISDQVYFGPQYYWAPQDAEFINQYALRLHKYEPSTNGWEVIEMTEEDGTPSIDSEFYPIDTEVNGEELMIAYLRQLWYSPIPELAIYSYNPVSKKQRKMSDIVVPQHSEGFKLLKTQNRIYMVSFSPKDEEWSPAQEYVALIQELDPHTAQVTSEKSFPTRGVGTQLVLTENKLVILGLVDQPYQYKFFGQIFDFSQNNAEYIEPTFSSIPTHLYFRFNFMVILGEEIYLGFDNEGNIVKWDINYRRP